MSLNISVYFHHKYKWKVTHNQVLTTSTSVVPNVFLPNPLKTERKQDQKAVVFISSPFALVKESLISFLGNISFHKVDFYFGSDVELIIQNNMNECDSYTNSDQIVSPLPYITECLNSVIGSDRCISSYSLCFNILPLCSSNILRNFFHSLLHLHQFRSFYGPSTSWHLFLPIDASFEPISLYRKSNP